MSAAFEIGRWRPAPLLPRRDEREGALIAAMVLLTALACLAAIAALAANRAAAGWIGQVSSSVTVVVRPKASDTPDQAAARAAEALSGLPGVIEARARSAAEIQALLAPWLGQGTDLSDLPTPRLVDLRLSPSGAPSAAVLQTALAQAGLDATLDDHRAWTGAIERTAGLVRWSAIAICALVAACAAAMIALSTSAALAARKEMIAVLHLAGGRDSYIARRFAWRAAETGLIAAALGAALADLIAAALRLAGGPAGLAPFLPVGWIDLAAAIAAPPLIALVAGAAAYAAARRLLRGMV